MKKDDAFNNLRDTINNINTLRFDYFLIDGTLLGAIREKNFITHDTDIDIGVLMDQWSIVNFTKFIEYMMLDGFILYHSFGIFGKHFEVSFYRNEIKVDLFFYYSKRDKLRFNAFLNGGRKLPEDIITYEYPNYVILPTKLVEFNGEIFRIPNNPEKVLELKYGKDWKIPRKKWDWAFGPNNVISRGKFI